MFARLLLYVFLPVQANGSPSNWVNNQNVGKWYRVSPNRLSFGDAERWCRKQGAHLAMPKTDTELNAVIDLLGDKTKFIWIGLDRIEMKFPDKSGFTQTWKWADGRILRDSQKLPSKSNMTVGSKLCARMITANKTFDDAFCWKTYKFLCERPDWVSDSDVAKQTQRCPGDWTYFDCGDLCYIRVELDPDLTEKNKSGYCRSQHAQIAMPKSSRQHRAVLLMLHNNSDQARIGVTRTEHSPTQFEYDDGTIYTGHVSSSRQKIGSQSSCMSMNMTGVIRTRKCSRLKVIVCQKPQTLVNPNSTSECGRMQHRTKEDVQISPNNNTTSEPNSNINDSPNNDISESTSKESTSQAATVPSASLDIGSIHGGESIDIEEFPWSVRVYSNHGQCGGVLIGPRHVLTAAHCVVDEYLIVFVNPSNIKVGVSSEDLERNSGRLESVQTVTIHPNHKAKNQHADHLWHDIAILELKKSLPVDCPDVRTACLQGKELDDYDHNTTCRLAGWGLGSNKTLKFCDMSQILSPQDPNNSTFIPGHESVFFDDVDTSCYFDHGDSGSPLMCLDAATDVPEWFVLALMEAKLSTGEGKKDEDGNVVYNKQAYTYVKYFVDWIQGVKNKSEEFVYHETVCQTEDINLVDISCEYGRPPQIEIIRAFYGRRTDQICRWVGLHTYCIRDVTQKIAARCDGRNNCTFHVTSDYLGPDCPGTKNYFQLEYKCVEPKTLTGRVCTDDYLTISCGQENERVINVTGVYCGNQSDTVCHQVGMTSLKNATRLIITKRCDGKVSCSLNISKLEINAQCPNNTHYLEVKYKCNAVDLAKTNEPQASRRTARLTADDTARVCKDVDHLNISCDHVEGRLLEVTHAVYGRRAESVCPSREPTEDCSSVATEAIAERCNGKVRCSETISSFGFRRCGDDHYLDIDYKCRRGRSTGYLFLLLYFALMVVIAAGIGIPCYFCGGCNPGHREPQVPFYQYPMIGVH